MKFNVFKKGIKNLFKPIKKKKEALRIPGGLNIMGEFCDDDVFIVGFPKSGNTLTVHMIAHLIYGLNEFANRTLINFLVPDIYTNSHFLRFSDRIFFKSHELPKKEYKKVIYIYRDGREALLSYYHMQKYRGSNESIEDVFNTKGGVSKSSWAYHIEEWFKNPYKSDILYIKYEDLITSKLECLNKICKFLKLDRTEYELNQVLNFTSFQHMRNLETREDWKKMKGENHDKGYFVRKGKVDSFREEVPMELLEKFNELHANRLRNWHYRR